MTQTAYDTIVIIFLCMFVCLTIGCSKDASSTFDELDSESSGTDVDTGFYGEYEDGIYHCCAQGEGTDCCEGYEQGMCFEYGGIYSDCVSAGEWIEGKIICAKCCLGLVRRGIFDENCQNAAPVSLAVCVACGDGVCGNGEDNCNCPEDCQ